MEQIRRLLDQGRYAEAARIAAASDRRDPDLRILHGLALGGGGDLSGALRHLLAAAQARPDDPHPCLDLLPILRRCGRAQDIEPCLLAALAARPHAPLVALALARHALAVRPGLAEAHRLIAWILADLGDLAASAEHSRLAVSLDPLDAAAWTNLGVALTDLGRLQEAERAHAEALRLKPQDPRIRVNRAVNLLAQGKLAEAWADYEWRLGLPGHTALPTASLLPDLDLDLAGNRAIAGKTILLTHEDGLGDSIQFVRFAPLLADRGARVLLHAPPPLERLFAALDPRCTMLPSASPLPAFDYHCPYTSLPRAFGVSLDTIPAAPYLRADPALVDRWRRRLPCGGPRIGLVWAGQARPWLEGYGPLDGRRSMPFATLAPLAQVPGVNWISLQKGPAEAELATSPPGFGIVDVMNDVRDFADTAAIIASLDLVISVDTSVAHLAGALGTPVFLLDRYDTCWRWLRHRTDSPWYPKLVIFRQETLGTGQGRWA